MGMRLRTGWLIGAGAAVVLALGSAGAYKLTGGAQHTSAPPAMTRVQRGTVTTAVAATGTLQPARERSLTFSVDGTVTEVRVRVGDQVAAGQVLARVDDTTAKDRVDSAQDALDAAQQALDQAQTASASPTNPADGDTGCLAAVAYVTAATPTSTQSPSPSRSATTAPPAPHGSPTPSTSHGTQTGVPGGGSRPGGGCPTGGSSGPRTGAGGAGTDRVLAAQQQVNSAELRLAQAQQDLAGTTITAPIAGKVLSVAGAVGSRATAVGAAFIVLGDVAEMQVKADFPEADASGLKVGQRATVTLADRPGQSLPAKVTQVDPIGTVDGQMVRFGALLAFDQVPDGLLSGQSAGVRVETQSVSDVLYVPAGAVRVDGVGSSAESGGSGQSGGSGTGTVLFRVGDSTEERQVQIGLRGDQYTEIRSGLAEGDEVVSSW